MRRTSHLHRRLFYECSEFCEGFDLGKVLRREGMQEDVAMLSFFFVPSGACPKLPGPRSQRLWDHSEVCAGRRRRSPRYEATCGMKVETRDFL